MRPLDKGKGVDYGYPLQDQDELKWNKSAGKGGVPSPWEALNAITGFDPVRMTAEIALKLALALNTGTITKTYNEDTKQINDGKPLDEITKKTAVKTILDKVADIYKKAGGPLAKALGPFCAYCETYITTLIEVDHVANKSYYPTLAIEWLNFLPACGPCNNTKSNKPSREVAAVDPPPPQLLQNLNDDTPFYLKIRKYFAWPDEYADTFQFFGLVFAMSVNDGVTWQPMSYSDAANFQYNELVGEDLTKGEIRANLWHKGKLCPGVLAQVWIKEGGNLTEMCGLNAESKTTDDTGNITYDRRVYNRTLAWFAALGVMKPLLKDLSWEAVQVQWPAIQWCSKLAGFWSVWVTLLSQCADVNDGTFDQNLGAWFYKSPDADDFYPGTDTNSIVLPARQ